MTRVNVRFPSDLSGSRISLPCTFAAWTARKGFFACVMAHMRLHGAGMFCGVDDSGNVCCLQSETCFSCCEGYSSYLCIISWAGRERGFVPFEEAPPDSFLSLVTVIHRCLRSFLSLFFFPCLLLPFRQLEPGFGLAGGCKVSFQGVAGFFGSGAEARLSHSGSSLH